MPYFCCDERRREGVRATNIVNGIEFLEVDSEAADVQRVLRVQFLNRPAGALAAITKRNVHIEGGVRITDITVDAIAWDGSVLVVDVDRYGDFSRYTLRITDEDGKPLVGLDEILSEVDFTFKADCPSDFDCKPEQVCSPDLPEPPEIDYLARDYASFRTLMIDRMSALLPEWRERNPADLGVALIEALAYSADHLSYELDATAMEASLATARRRTSVRRHARLVDYYMHDGANARAWVQVRLDPNAGDVPLSLGTQFLTQVPSLPQRIVKDSPDYQRALREGCVVFEPMESRTLHSELNEMRIYTWGDRECCIAAGATSVDLYGKLDNLSQGDVIVFVERLGPKTGAAGDANPQHRHAIRLSEHPTHPTDPIGSWFDDENAPVTPVELTRIRWSLEDALPFPLCVSAKADEEHYYSDVSIVLGNIVLADHGCSVSDDLDCVPEPDERLAVVAASSTGHCVDSGPALPVPRYQPVLPRAPLTMAGTTGRTAPGADQRRWLSFDRLAPAARAMVFEPRHVLPDISLQETPADRRWLPRRDLIASAAFDAEFVAEIDPYGHARLRFGDGEYSMRPVSGAKFRADYRIGNGPEGNIGADALWHVVSPDAAIVGVRNPMPATGGLAPETVEHVRQMAPSAFRVQQRAVTADDYAEVTERHPQVQRAVATERWTNSWYTIFLTIDRVSGLPVDTEFETEIREHLERFRMAGQDVEIDGPHFVWIELGLNVCVLPEFHASDVEQAVLQVLSSGTLQDGRRAFFHPDNFTFAQPVYLSKIIAVVQEVRGVRMVDVTMFRRLGDERSTALKDGRIATGRLEIARLDNDPNFPDRGVLTLTMEGGQ